METRMSRSVGSRPPGGILPPLDASRVPPTSMATAMIEPAAASSAAALRPPSDDGHPVPEVGRDEAAGQPGEPDAGHGPGGEGGRVPDEALHVVPDAEGLGRRAHPLDDEAATLEQHAHAGASEVLHVGRKDGP